MGLRSSGATLCLRQNERWNGRRGEKGEREGGNRRNPGQDCSRRLASALLLSEGGWDSLCGWPMLPGPPSVFVRSEKPRSYLSQVKPLRGVSLYLL